MGYPAYAMTMMRAFLHSMTNRGAYQCFHCHLGGQYTIIGYFPGSSRCRLIIVVNKSTGRICRGHGCVVRAIPRERSDGG